MSAKKDAGFCGCFGGKDDTPEGRRKDAGFRVLVGVVVTLMASNWLGNEVGWWELSLPFWPIMALVMGVGILLSAVRSLSAPDGSSEGTSEI